MKKIALFFVLLCVIIFSVEAQVTPLLKFNNNGQFKIAQFTDLHWDNNSSNCALTAEVIKHVLTTEKPDLAILTGDVVTAPPAKDGWLAIARIFAEAKTPWGITMGNHDSETDVSRDEIFDIVAGLPYYVGEKGAQGITGVGNYVLPVMAHTNNRVAAALYLLDSNNKPIAHKYGHYDWIHFDQINWYRDMSESFTAKNGGKPIPSLAFFHIPILEFNNVIGGETTVGNKREGVASPDINSGLFCSFVEMGDVMGVFTGHDHNNDYIGIEQDIALAFGRTSGIDAYGELERGARIINLYEDSFRFDTWIRTRKGTEFEYYFPSGLSSVDDASMTFLPSVNAAKGVQGVHYKYYEAFRKLKKVGDIEPNSKLIKEGQLNNLSLVPAAVSDSFAFVYEGLLDVPTKGVYRFYTYSDDGSQLFIDAQLVVDNDGSHNARRVDGKVALEAGLHRIKVIYFENYMGEVLEVGWSSRWLREEPLPDNVLYIEKK